MYIGKQIDSNAVMRKTIYTFAGGSETLLFGA
jgi:hypothetical protein